MAAKPKPSKPPKPAPLPQLAEVRARIDAIDRQIQALIAERAEFALQVGKAKGKLAAALEFARFLSTPERAADWGIATGYVATRPDAWATEAMKKYAAEFPPAAIARDQLKDAVAELSTHDNQRVTKALNDALQAVLTGTKQAKPALDEAQAEATRLLATYQH